MSIAHRALSYTSVHEQIAPVSETDANAQTRIPLRAYSRLLACCALNILTAKCRITNFEDINTIVVYNRRRDPMLIEVLSA